MTAKKLENLAGTGLLKSEPGEQEEFNGLVAAGRAALIDAGLEGLSSAGRFDRAYKAAHAFSLAALRWHGFRPNRQRYIVFQVLPLTLSATNELSRVLDKCHQLRNLAEYEGRFDADDRLMQELLDAARWLERAVGKLGPMP